MSLKAQASGLIGGLVAANVLLWLGTLIAGIKYPQLIWPCFLAYTFGLRHAVDADHIAAIDNVTRKLIRDGQRPLTVGLWFSFGHSTVVYLLCAMILSGSAFLQDNFHRAQGVGKIIGTTVSATVLFLIGSVNICTTRDLVGIWKRLRKARLEQGTGHEQYHPPCELAVQTTSQLDSPEKQTLHHNHHHFPNLPKPKLPKWFKAKLPKSLKRLPKVSVCLGCRRGFPPPDEDEVVPASKSQDAHLPFLSSPVSDCTASLSTAPSPVHTHGKMSKLHRFFHGHSHGFDLHPKQFDASNANDVGSTTLKVDTDDDDNEHTHLVEVNVDAEVEGPGFLTKCCPRLFNVVDVAWKMYPIGFLFGLGFDTASEVGLLALAALTPREHIPTAFVMLLPVMFSIGMALIDTLDGVLMLWAYGWAEIDPTKKICFNLFLSASSAVVAIVVGAIEVLGCLHEEFNLKGGFWNGIGIIADHFEYVGAGIVVFFLISSLLTILGFTLCVV